MQEIVKLLSEMSDTQRWVVYGEADEFRLGASRMWGL